MQTPEPDWATFRPPTDGLAAALDEIRSALVALDAAEDASASTVRAMEMAGKARALETLADRYVLQAAEAHGAMCRRQREAVEARRFVDNGEGRGFGPKPGQAR